MKTLSKAAGLSHDTLGQIARKESGSFESLKPLRELTGVNLNWLICGEGSHEMVLTDAAKAKIVAASVQPDPPKTPKTGKARTRPHATAAKKTGRSKSH